MTRYRWDTDADDWLHPLILELLSDNGDTDLRGARAFKLTSLPTEEFTDHRAGFTVPCPCGCKSIPPTWPPKIPTPAERTIQVVRMVPQEWATPKRYFRIWVGMCPECKTLYYTYRAELREKRPA